MPKIPTFKSRERITGEVGGVTSDISVSPFRTTGAAIAKVARAAEDYYIKERNIKEKTEAAKAFVELSSELDTIQEGASNQFDLEEANNIFLNQSQFLLKEKLSKIKNKRVKSMLQNDFDLDLIERKIKIKQNVRDRLDEEFEYNNKIKKEQNFSRYKIAKTSNEKQIIREKLLADEENNGMSLGDSSITIQKNKDIIRQDLLVFDVEKLIENRRYETAKNILEDIEKTPFLESEKRSELLDQIQEESLEFNETNLYVDQILKGVNPFISADFKNTTKKKVLQTTDNLLQSQAAQNNYNEQQTFAYVDKVFAETGILSPTYENLFEFAYNAGSTTTFDSPADIPNEIKLAVKSAEIADRTGRLNVYTNKEQERFFKNVIALKKIKGLNDFEAIRQAKEFEMNYDQRIIAGANRQRNKMLDRIEDSKTFRDTKATNIGEVKSYANQLYDMYVSLGINDFKAQEQVIEDLENSIVEIDDHAYLKRDIESFKSIRGLDQVKPVKEYILKNRLPNEDPDEYYLRHIGGGLFEIRREVDLSPVYGDDGDLLLFYPQDLSRIASQAKTEQETTKREKVKELQEKKQEAAQEFKESVGFEIEGS